MKILSLDQSSTKTGWAIFENGKLLDYGLIRTMSNDSASVRRIKLKNEVKQIVEKYNINEVILEGVYYSKLHGFSMYSTLSMVLGSLIDLCTELKIPYRVITNTTWKTIISDLGKTRSIQKPRIVEWVLDTYKVEVKSDIADAIAIGTYYERNKEFM